ncbi:glycosyltransferase [Thiocapsa sp.]|uniref:glycosyltransferase n=1 Tax=Thiocapsa sp. TaxID=2024551 RepID=UPI0035944B31
MNYINGLRHLSRRLVRPVSLSRRPKVLVVLPAGAVGGAETRTLTLLRGLEGFDRVLVTQSAVADIYQGLGLPVYRFDDYGCRDPYLCTISENVLRYARVIADIARSEDVDILLGMMHNGTTFANAAKHVFLLRVRSVGTILGNVSGYFSQIQRAPTAAEERMLRFCTQGSNGVIVPSEGIKTDLVANFGANPRKIQIIYNGIDLDRTRDLARAPCDLPRHDLPRVITACRLSDQKDFSTLLRAFRLVLDREPSTLVIVGDGELRAHVEQMISDLQLTDHVIMTGFQSNPFPYMKDGALFVLSSYFEGFGNVLVEAMSLGKPVVATDCPSGPGEIILEGTCGHLVAVGDHEGMAAAILKILQNQEYRRHLSAGAIARSEVFSAKAMIEGFDSYFKRFVDL